MFKYNDPTKGAPKVGNSGGEAFPPGKYIIEFAKAKESVSADAKNNRAGQQQLVTEWIVKEIVRGGEDYKNWDGRTMTAFPEARRSYVFKLNYAGTINDVNELCILLHGVDAKSSKALRESGFALSEESPEEMSRLGKKLNDAIKLVVSEDGTNPFMGYCLQLEVEERKNPKTGNTFMRHTFEQFPLAAEHNAEILQRAGVFKIAA